MAKRNNKQSRRIRNLVLLCSICAVVLVVSTYAWFIGMKTVRVSSFDVEIATTEGLFLSMNGNDWYYNLDAKGTPAYDGNTNTWALNGLIPMSTIGDMDPVSSRMKLYEKASWNRCIVCFNRFYFCQFHRSRKKHHLQRNRKRSQRR